MPRSATRSHCLSDAVQVPEEFYGTRLTDDNHQNTQTARQLDRGRFGTESEKAVDSKDSAPNEKHHLAYLHESIRPPDEQSHRHPLDWMNQTQNESLLNTLEHHFQSG